MDKAKYASALISANYKSGLWMIIAGLMLFSNVCLAVFVLTADTSEKTIVVPPDLEKPFSVKGDELSSEYIEQMTRYFSQLLLTYQPQNANAQFGSVLRFTSPSIYGELKARFDLDEERINRNSISSVFYLKSINIKKNVALIEGEQLAIVGSRLVSNKQKKYRLEYTYNSGRFYLSAFNEMRRGASGEDEFLPAENVELVEVPTQTDAAVEQHDQEGK